jgi:hypothetical protein
MDRINRSAQCSAEILSVLTSDRAKNLLTPRLPTFDRNNRSDSNPQKHQLTWGGNVGLAIPSMYRIARNYRSNPNAHPTHLAKNIPTPRLPTIDRINRSTLKATSPIQSLILLNPANPVLSRSIDRIDRINRNHPNTHKRQFTRGREHWPSLPLCAPPFSARIFLYPVSTRWIGWFGAVLRALLGRLPYIKFAATSAISLRSPLKRFTCAIHGCPCSRFRA